MSGPFAVILTVRSYGKGWTKEKALQLSLPALLHFHKNIKQQFKHICFSSRERDGGRDGGGGWEGRGERRGPLYCRFGNYIAHAGAATSGQEA